MPFSDSLLIAAVDLTVWDTLRDILLLLIIAVVMGTLAEAFRQSVIVGYLLAGTLVGPSVLGWIGQQQQLFAIAELGVALLLFVIGLEFSPRRLLELGRVTLLTGPLQVLVTLAAGWGCARLFGLPFGESLVIGMMVAMSSTASVLRLLADRAEMESLHGRGALGILLIQDVAVVPMMLIVSAMAGGGSTEAIAGRVSWTLVVAVGLLAAFYVVSTLLVPRYLSKWRWQRNRDLPTLVAVTLALGSGWAAHQFNLSPALGSFAAGVLLAISPFATQIRADVRPLSTLLVTLFFASIGMFGDPFWLAQHLLLVSGIVAAVVIGKPLIIALLVRGFGQPWRYAWATALCLAQIGEFSFVLATIAQEQLNGEALMSETTFRAMVSATLVTLLLTPYLVARATQAGEFADRLLARGKGQPPREAAKRPAAAAEEATSDERILIIGFGPAGQRVAEGLIEMCKERLTVVDLNAVNVSIAEGYGLAAHFGDATQTDVLEHAGIHQTAIVVIALPDHATTRQLIQLIRDLVPDTFIVARCRYHIRHWELLLAGAHEVVDEEDHVGRRLAAQVRQVLGRS